MSRELLFKLIGMGVLAVLLMMPVSMVRELIAERQTRRAEAVSEIARGWGERQVVAGPVLVAGYRRTWTEVVSEMIDGKPRERRTERSETGSVRLPVDAVDWTVDLATSEKSRGIHKARLYSAKLSATGRITVAANYGLSDPHSKYEWTDAQLVVAVADPRGIRSVSALTFDAGRSEFAPAAGAHALDRGFHASVGVLDVAKAATHTFSFSAEIAGSEAFAVSPLGKNTSVALKADWPHPSFYGPYLPASHRIEADRFSADWRVSEYAAAAGTIDCMQPKKGCAQFGAEVLGVSLIEPVGVYQQLDRSTKYGLLFVGLLFAAFFLFEMLRRLAIHPIQYALVGLALGIFFLLITALSEHVAFGLAYLAGAAACVSLIGFYLARVLGSTSLAAIFSAGLAGLYGALYMLLNAEDYALLAGALLLFALLAGVMLATRRIDWYQLTATVR